MWQLDGGRQAAGRNVQGNSVIEIKCCQTKNCQSQNGGGGHERRRNGPTVTTVFEHGRSSEASQAWQDEHRFRRRTRNISMASACIFAFRTRWLARYHRIERPEIAPVAGLPAGKLRELNRAPLTALISALNFVASSSSSVSLLLLFVLFFSSDAPWIWP